MDLGFPLNSSELVRKCIAILGIRGSGKSNTAKILGKELIKEGFPLVVIDPDGEYDFQEALRIEDFNLDPEVVAKDVLERKRSLIIDMNEWNDEAFNFLFKFLDSFWNLSKIYRTNVFLVIEEAHEFIPQGERTKISEEITRLALRGRKRGIGMIMISQRSARVNKDVLTQSEVYFLHKVVHPVDLKVYREILPLKAKEVADVVKSLDVGEALFYMNGRVEKVKIRKFDESTTNSQFAENLA
ncbi:ATP-binding protein [Acidianus sp.]|jgi:Predicted ATPase|uniref:ATP-binding protein n=1 Tax=Acidianus sp. TaxID=1872104 RepID=UPI00397C3D0D